ncbi:MAG: T9SS type A sorting domain-containing protein, partial [Saprospiraceae bacterium]
LIAIAKFVVIDDLDGFKLNNTQFSIKINAASVTNGAGQVSTLASDTYTFELDLSQATEERPEAIDASQVQLAPNPTSSWIRVDLYSQLEAADIEVFNLAGQRVLTQTGINNRRTELNVSNLPNGMYFMQVHTTNGGVVHKKFEVFK